MNDEKSAVDLDQVRIEFETWRGQKRGRDRIPERLWKQAAILVPKYGLNRVSLTLRLNSQQLKRWCGSQENHQSPVHAGLHRGTAARPEFVELKPGGVDGGELPCMVELEKSNGTKMRIRVGGGMAVDWNQIKETFIGA